MVAFTALTLAALISPRVPTRCRTSMSIDDDMERRFHADMAKRDIREAQFGPPRSILRNRNSAYVLLFNANRWDEGAYTLQGKQADTYMVAFDDCSDAGRFAYQLQAEGFALPQPSQWSAEQLVSFCDTAGFYLSLVPSGALLLPPEHNVFAMDAFEQLDASGATPSGANPQPPMHPAQSNALSQAVREQRTYFEGRRDANDEAEAERARIEAARERLERLWRGL